MLMQVGISGLQKISSVRNPILILSARFHNKGSGFLADRSGQDKVFHIPYEYEEYGHRLGVSATSKTVTWTDPFPYPLSG
jgi:hypothetical protein